jgi:IclR family acetate operon transcriptional repressor
MREKPASALSSVDTALLLIHLLRDQGEVGVTEAAGTLGISISSAHRLLTTLVHRDFAERTDRRRYVAGAALALRPGAGRPVVALREVLRPTMGRLARTLGETTSLGVLVDDSVRIIATVEAERLLRVGDQEGTVLPARKTAIGRAILAFLPWESARAHVAPTSVASAAGDIVRLRAELRGARERGFAVNHGEAEAGVTAVGVPVFDRELHVQAGLAFVMPSARFDDQTVESQVRALMAGARSVRDELDSIAINPVET